MKPADIGFVMNHGNLISRTMATFMGAPWGHTIMIMGQDQEGRTLTLETSDFEVAIDILDERLKNPTVSVKVFDLGLSDEDRKLVVEEALKNKGKVYGYLQLISLGLRCLLRRVNIKISNFIRIGLVCTAVPLYGYLAIGDRSPFGGLDPESIDTGELAELIESKGFKVLIDKKGSRNGKVSN